MGGKRRGKEVGALLCGKLKKQEALLCILCLALQLVQDWGAAFVTPTDLILGLHLSLISWYYHVPPPPETSTGLSPWLNP